jgi:hypothetical protein
LIQKQADWKKKKRRKRLHLLDGFDAENVQTLLQNPSGQVAKPMAAPGREAHFNS